MEKFQIPVKENNDIKTDALLNFQASVSGVGIEKICRYVTSGWDLRIKFQLAAYEIPCLLQSICIPQVSLLSQ